MPDRKKNLSLHKYFNVALIRIAGEFSSFISLGPLHRLDEIA